MNKKELLVLKNEFIISKKLEEKSERTINHYTFVLDLLFRFLPEDVDITKLEILQVKEEVIKLNYSISTYNNYITIIDTFFKFCNSEELCLKKRKVQQKGSLIDVLEPNDYKRMVRWADKLNMQQCRLIMMVLASTGIRVAELKYFTVEAVKKGCFIEVTNKGKSRNVILTNALRKELKKYIRSNKIESGYIFRSKKYYSRPAVDKTIWSDIKKVAGYAKVSLKKAHPHSFRHLFAITYLANGGTMADLADILGHSSLETTRIYGKTTDEMKKKMIEKMRFKSSFF